MNIWQVIDNHPYMTGFGIMCVCIMGASIFSSISDIFMKPVEEKAKGEG